MEDFRGWKLVLLTLLVILLVTVAGYGFDLLLNSDGVNRKLILVVSNGLTGLVVAGLFLTFIRNIRNHRRLIEARLEVIVDMNHHIRNALQVLTYGAARHENERETEMMREAIGRIQWALREVLPGYVPERHIPREPAPPGRPTPVS